MKNSIHASNLLDTQQTTVEGAVYIVKGSRLHSFIAQQDPSMWSSIGYDYYRLHPKLYSMLLLLV